MSSATAPQADAAAIPSDSSVRSQMAAAAVRIRRLKRIDRLAVGVITLGGVAVVASVIGILVFIGAEAIPLFRSASAALDRSVPLAETAGTPGGAMAAVGTDEGRRFVYVAEPVGQLTFYAAGTGARVESHALTSIAGVAVTSSSRSLTDDHIALGTADGRVALAQVRFAPAAGGEAERAIQLIERGVAIVDLSGRPVRRVAYLAENDQTIVAAQVSDDALVAWWRDSAGAEKRQELRFTTGGAVTVLAVGRTGTIIAGTDRGEIGLWDLGDAAVQSGHARVGESPITALSYVIGHRTLIVGAANGQVTAWFMAPVGADDTQQLVQLAAFEPHRGAVRSITASTRDRTFATASADGEVRVHHQTSGRTLVTLPGATPARHVVMTPRSDGLIVAREGGVIDQYALSNAHPEISWKVLFGKVWYEGYAAPEYVWQSTAGTDDFEPKLSLVPLVFGTIKGTFYALIIAVPLAVLGALYTSQFTHPRVRARIKPTVEIMAALPSVVIGFIAGLYLAPIVERHLVGVMTLFVTLPVFGTSGFLVWRWLPAGIQRRLKLGSELLLILPMLLVGGWLAVTVAPGVEALLFGGDARQWLADSLGLTYDQRNSLVVGVAMGFAVIPIIFTISEDAFSSVPSTLTAASLALGASRWQTAVRVVIPTASPGVFSAIMVGFGRAVGETMIVLMATGNTPVLDWSIFNGFRTLSANIAVEIPEAPQGGTLYRTLFLAASLLFLITFTVNTVAEVIRQRLRERYRAV